MTSEEPAAPIERGGWRRVGGRVVLTGAASLVLVLGLALAASLRAPTTVAFRALLVCSLLVAFGVALWSQGQRGGRALTFTAGLTVSVVVVVRALGVPPVGVDPGLLERWPGSAPAGWPSRVVDEEDGVQLAFTLLGPAIATAAEQRGFADALHVHYERLRRAHRHAPTPLVETLFGMQEPRDFEILRIPPPSDAAAYEAPAGAQPTDALVFFHGAAGNWGLLCQLVAEPAGALGMVTYCPSTDVTGLWDRPRGRRIAAETLAEVRRRGATRVVVAGLSAGARTAHAWASATEETGALAGVILLYGMDPELETRAPVAVIYGERDERFSADHVRRGIARLRWAAPHVTEQSIDADHFGLVKRAEETQHAIGDALRILTLRASVRQSL